MQINSVNRKLSLTTATIVLAGLLPLAGCRICADCEDLAYPAYGGSWQRTERYHGRVGSLFDPGGGKAPDLVDRDTPPDPDELERQRQEGKTNLFDRESYPPDSDSEQPPMDPLDPLDELRERELDDIRDEQEEKLRERELDDINVDRRPNPNSPVAAALKSLFK